MLSWSGIEPSTLSRKTFNLQFLLFLLFLVLSGPPVSPSTWLWVWLLSPLSWRGRRGFWTGAGSQVRSSHCSRRATQTQKLQLGQRDNSSVHCKTGKTITGSVCLLPMTPVNVLLLLAIDVIFMCTPKLKHALIFIGGNLFNLCVMDSNRGRQRVHWKTKKPQTYETWYSSVDSESETWSFFP